MLFFKSNVFSLGFDRSLCFAEFYLSDISHHYLVSLFQLHLY